MAGVEVAKVTVEFRTEFRVVEGSVPNFRRGAVRISSEGVLIDGQAVLPYEYQLPVFVLGLFLTPLWLAAYLVMEYGMRRRECQLLPWKQVRRMASVPREQLVCIVYDARNFRGRDRVYSLSFPLNQSDYEAVTACATICRPEKAGEGKLRWWTSPINWAFGLFLITVCVCLFAAMLFGGR